jgi:hypothetical protein
MKLRRSSQKYPLPSSLQHTHSEDAAGRTAASLLIAWPEESIQFGGSSNICDVQYQRWIVRHHRHSADIKNRRQMITYGATLLTRLEKFGSRGN